MRQDFQDLEIFNNNDELHVQVEEKDNTFQEQEEMIKTRRRSLKRNTASSRTRRRELRRSR
jgi:hypothetical protein